MTDRLVRLRHLLDQLGGDLKEIAPILRQEYRAYRQEGMGKLEALELVKDTKRMLLGQNPTLPDDLTERDSP